MGSEFHGDAYVNSGVDSATTDVCGNLYVINAESVQTNNSSSCTTCSLWDSEENRVAINSLFTNKLIQQHQRSSDWIFDAYHDGEVENDWYSGSYTYCAASADDLYPSLYAQYEVNGYSVAKHMYPTYESSIVVQDIHYDQPQHSLDAPVRRVLDLPTGS
jgi:hypothetical protein